MHSLPPLFPLEKENLEGERFENTDFTFRYKGIKKKETYFTISYFIELI